MLRKGKKHIAVDINELSPSGNGWQMVDFTISNPSSSPININLFDVTAPPILPSSPNTLPPTLIDAVVNVGGATPYFSAYCPVNNCLYVANSDATVSVINASTYSIITSIVIGSNGCGVSYNPITNTMYVVCQGVSKVDVIDCATNTVLTEVLISGFPFSITYNSLNNTMYVGSNAGTIDVVDCATNTLLTTINTGGTEDYFSLAYSPNSNKVYAPDSAGSNLFIVDCATNTFTTLFIASSLYGICYNSIYDRVYITSAATECVYSVSCATGALVGSPVLVGTFPLSIGFEAMNNLVYVCNSTADTLSVISCSLGTLINTIPTVISPYGITYNSSNNSFAITNNTTGNVTFIIPVATISVVSSSIDYNQFVSDSGVNPKIVRQVVISAPLAQLYNNINILKKDMYGKRFSDWKYPNLQLSKFMNQSTIVEINFGKKNDNNLILDLYTSFNQYRINANTTITLLLYYKEAVMAERLNSGGNIMKRLLIENNSQDAAEKQGSQIENFGETVLTMDEILNKIK
jgi:YVTN family beta-propeller protein